MLFNVTNHNNKSVTKREKKKLITNEKKNFLCKFFHFEKLL